MTPGMQVRVVNSYEAASLAVDVIKLRKVDYKNTSIRACLVVHHKHGTVGVIITLPTEGNPIRATLASPDFITSKPSPLAPADFEGSRSWALYLANLAFNKPRWYSVAAKQVGNQSGFNRRRSKKDTKQLKAHWTSKGLLTYLYSSVFERFLSLSPLSFPESPLSMKCDMFPNVKPVNITVA